jgi:uncharacterized protein DUF1588/uncharacterized protein DUF1592/uncharacterized protein DUF1595/uncharacterized protein DUF1585/uncharacterized protein DUF1587
MANVGADGSAAPSPSATATAGPAIGPAAGRRLTNDEYLNTIGDLLGVDLSGVNDASLLPGDQPATGGGFRNDIEGLLPSAVRTDAYETLATRVAERIAWAGGIAAYATCTDPTSACREGFVRQLGRLLYRRPLTAGDVQNLLPLFDAAGTGANAFESGARLVLEAMLQSPHFLYRLERLDSVDPKTGQTAPTPFEIATRLSYLAWLSAPTPGLLDAAQRGDLSVDASFLSTVDGLLADPHARRGFEGYAQDWMQLYRLDARTPTPQLGVPQALLTEMKEETLRFLDRVALTEGRDLTRLFTDKKTELGPALAGVYGVNPPAQGFATYDLANDPNRIGILTEPGFLILLAAPERATIVNRGLMVLRVFLCAEVPAPPAGAAAQIQSVPANLTDRDRFALHTTSPACKGCHDTFDPLGYPFEPYDLAGRFRTTDEYGNVLRSDGQVTLDGTAQAYKNTAEFAALLAQSADVQRCFVSKLFQYGLGRSLQGADKPAIDDLAQRFKSAGRTYLAAVRSVATSPALRTMAPGQ